jgi:hypothetical protein
VDGGDDLLGIDALQVDGGGAEVGVAELALDDVQGDAFVGELEGVGVAQLLRGKSPPHPGLGREAVQLGSHTRTGPAAAAGGAFEDAELWTDRQLGADREPGTQLLPAPGVDAPLAAPAALAVADEQRPAALVEVGLEQ